MSHPRHSSVRITSLVLLFPVLVLLIYGGLMYLYFAYAQNRDTRWELMQYEDRLMDSEVGNLKEKVHNMATYVRYYDSQSANKIKKDVQNIVNAAVNVADSLYDGYRYTQSRPYIETMIVHALENIHFEGDIGYLFILDMKGNVKLHHDRSRIGKNDMHVRDSNGKAFVEAFVRTIRKRGEGFVDYYWYLPDANGTGMHYKISFVKRMKGLNWFIGAGEYLHYMRRFVRKDMLEYIRSNAHFDEGYFFVTDSAGHTIYHPEDNATADANRYLIEGVYRDDDRIAYTEYVAQYDWYITAVKSLKKVNASIQQNKEYIIEKRAKNIRASLGIMLAMLLLSLLLSLYLSSIINRRLRNYEEQIQESNDKLLFQSRQALIGELMPMIAHQWRQPINRIASVLALMRFGIASGECDPKKIDQECATMEESVEFMSETIDDFRTFYRPKNESEIVDLSKLILKAIEFVDGPIRQKNIQLTTHLHTIKYRLYANEFLQVLINLIKNAADASEQNGQITIDLFEKEGVVRTVVTDRGKGIPTDDVNKIFEPYYSTKENSMGLGLYMSKMIVEKHMHGEIRAEPMAEGGTRFVICLYRQE
jgi:signal transduction histidine kinase